MTKLPNSKSALRATVAELVADYLANGGKIKVCKPARARGAK